MKATGTLQRWRVVFASATVGWAILLPLAAFAASRPPEWSVTHLSAALPYAIGAIVCHQQPDRSFALWSRQLPVCARCAGIYAGAALLSLIVLTFRRGKVAQGFLGPPKRVTREGASRARTLLLIAALPTIATLVYEWAASAAPPNAVRAFAGVPLGAAVALLIQTALDDQVN
jgi:Predicted membrane protein (DUF2085)